MKVQLNSDTAALVKRENINKLAKYDLEEWLFRKVHLRKNIKVLDLGCGTGKQIFALSEILSQKCNIIGIDISPVAIAKVNEEARSIKAANIKAVECELDQVVDYFKGKKFDLILSSYAIYYAKDMIGLISALPQLLTPKGEFFFCGPGKGTNKEIYSLINKNISNKTQKIKTMDDFILKKDIDNIASRYTGFRIERLQNKINFTSPGDILTWWKNHDSFVPEVFQEVSLALDSYFDNHDMFTLTKNVLGVLYYVQRF